MLTSVLVLSMEEGDMMKPGALNVARTVSPWWM